MREEEIREDDEEEEEKELNYQTWRQNRKDHKRNNTQEADRNDNN